LFYAALTLYYRLAVWFFVISVAAHWSCIERKSLTFAMTWYSFVFPNTALITATFAVGKAFDCYSIQVIGCVMTCFLILVWMFVFTMMIRAIILKQILWPQRQEDRDEGGFKGPEMRRGSMGQAMWEKSRTVESV
jgi:tellurite resistance protein TehA-like permease